MVWLFLRQVGDGVVVERFTRHQIFGKTETGQLVVRRRRNAAIGIDIDEFEGNIAFGDAVRLVDFDEGRRHAVLCRGLDRVADGSPGRGGGDEDHIDGILLYGVGEIGRIDLRQLHLVERERGLDFQEDLFCPCLLEFDLAPRKPAITIASTVVHNASEWAALKANEMARRAPRAADALTATLNSAAAQFIVRRGNFYTVIAGYPWFTDWGRDTMIALPGLTLATARFDIARGILLEFAACADRGMLPNVFPDASETPEYNTVDATLWFFEATRQYIEYSNDLSFVRTHLYEMLNEIIDWHVRGTRFGIHADTDGLLAAGDGNTQLTWMDARVNGRPVTPRNGKPVEIQALWYNALKFAAWLANDFGDQSVHDSHEARANQASQSLNHSFWNEEAGCLYDVIDGDRRDSSMRPNQAIALSLGYCAIPAGRARSTLAAVERHLLTPFGLRTLAPFDPCYRGRYAGPVAERDSAYHQGTVWPWLLGPFLTADTRFNGRSRAHELLEPLRAFVVERGAGQIPEIFDGDPPHEPRGCFAQAWSVAEILRTLNPTATKQYSGTAPNRHDP